MVITCPFEMVLKFLKIFQEFDEKLIWTMILTFFFQITIKEITLR
jgi:hypothetical protein